MTARSRIDRAGVRAAIGEDGFDRLTEASKTEWVVWAQKNRQSPRQINDAFNRMRGACSPLGGQALTEAERKRLGRP